jgi:NAD(P)-dependent dehydrogenase (short-subunit alcohol dehydrogenase family)
MGGARLEGKVVVVTGGGSGLGRACAMRVAEEGAAACVVADIDHDAASRVADELVAATSSEVSVFALDVADEAACQALADHVLREHRRVDVLVAAAGISGHSLAGGTSAVHGSYDAWRRILAVNLDGVLLTNRAIARVMIDAGVSGSIVNITSMCSAWTSGGATPYAVSKAGAWTLTKCLALELAPHQIRVNAVGPGFIETPMTAATRADEAAFDDITRRTPMKRFGLPTEIANAVLFLASDESSFVTGEILYADGGFNAPSR